MLKKKNFLTLLVADESVYQNYFLDSFLELALFLVRYEFILSEKKVGNNFSKREFPPLGELFSQNSNGARYLDPKYSRWISVDPALGEYVPSAGKSNEVDKLPGMGGIYNSVNLSLYHYAGNNPVRYTDPDGRDIEEVTLWSMSAAFIGGIRISFGVAVDSNGNIGVFHKLEFGIGAGADIGLDKLLKGVTNGLDFFTKICESISITDSGMKIGETLYKYPEDTGKGNLEKRIFAVFDTIKNWKTAPCEGALFIGAEGDKNGKTSLTIGLKAIAATYLVSSTTYLKIYDKQEWEDFSQDLKMSMNQLKNIIIDFFTYTIISETLDILK